MPSSAKQVMKISHLPPKSLKDLCESGVRRTLTGRGSGSLQGNCFPDTTKMHIKYDSMNKTQMR